MTDGKAEEDAASSQSDAEELLAKALRAHAARAAVPSTPTEPAEPAEPTEEPEADADDTQIVAPAEAENTTHTTSVSEQTTSLAPLPETANERTTTTRLNMSWPLETQNRMLAPHDVDSSLQIEAEFGPGYAAQSSGEASTVDHRRSVPGPPAPHPLLPVRWILLLALLLGLAAGALAGLLTVL